MPARKKPIGFNQRHYDARQIMELFGVKKSKAYDILHECRNYGSVIKTDTTLRASEEALQGWYNQHQVGVVPNPSRPGRPMKGAGYGVLAVEHI